MILAAMILMARGAKSCLPEDCFQGVQLKLGVVLSSPNSEDPVEVSIWRARNEELNKNRNEKAAEIHVCIPRRSNDAADIV